jgi:hypothetical protein
VAERRVVEALEAVKEVRVDEAVARNPPWKLMMVEVACSPVPSLVKGQGKEEPEHPVQLVTVRLPMLAIFALKLVVEARPETKKLEVVAFCKVVELRTSKSPLIVSLLVGVIEPIAILAEFVARLIVPPVPALIFTFPAVSPPPAAIVTLPPIPPKETAPSPAIIRILPP